MTASVALSSAAALSHPLADRGRGLTKRKCGKERGKGGEIE
jgi:hypothetical protein